MVTFLFTDIEGSTRLWERDAGTMSRCVERHDEIVAACVLPCGGQVVKSRGEGDSHFAVFDWARDAVAAALQIQRSLSREPFPDGFVIAIRAALHTGDAELRSGDYYGPDVIRCARLRAIAHGGQTIISHATAQAVGGDLPERATLTDLGRHRLKDLSAPEVVYQVCHPDLPAEFPPLNSLDRVRQNLPIQFTSFHGREREIQDLTALLTDGARLVTLTGPGGIGKTRLSLQVAANCLDHFDDGVWFVPFADVTDPDFMPAETAKALGVRETAGRDVAAAVAEEVRGKRILLVLDNLEHLPATRFVVDLLSAGPQSRILCTSRSPLRASGERLYSLDPLPAPTGDDDDASAAVALFCERARASDSKFRLTEANAAAIAAICRRLDGLPLAIELAAARVRAFPPRALLERLDSALPVLTGGPGDVPERQRTLRACIAWSYDLLTQPERALFARLSVFRGGMTVGATEDVCAAGMQTIESLADKSLLNVDESGRLSMLETLREYAAERLRDEGETEHWHRRHAEWFASLAGETGEKLHGSEGLEALGSLDLEHDNMRAALAWTLGGGADGLGLALAAKLGAYWDIRGQWSEGRRWLEAALAHEGDERSLVSALGWAGGLAHRQRDDKATIVWASRALAMARERGDERSAAGSLNLLGLAALRRGDLAEARTRLEEALLIRRRVGDRGGEAACLNNLGNLSRTMRDRAEARSNYERALAIFRELGDNPGTAATLVNVGTVLRDAGDLPGARGLFEESLAIRRELHDTTGIAQSLANLGAVATAQGDGARARACFAEALVAYRETEDRRSVVYCLSNLGALAWNRSDYAHARGHYEEALGICRAIGDRTGVTRALNDIGSVLWADGESSGARSRHDEALAICRDAGDRSGTATSLNLIGNVERAQHKYAEARLSYEEALVIFRELGEQRGEANCLGNIGLVCRKQGDGVRAGALLREVLVMLQELGDRAGMLESFEALAGLAADQRNGSRAARLFGASQALREATGPALTAAETPDHDADVESARTSIDEGAFDRAWKAGRSMTLDEVVAYALADD